MLVSFESSINFIRNVGGFAEPTRCKARVKYDNLPFTFRIVLATQCLQEVVNL